MHNVEEQDSSAGAKVGVGVRFRDGVVRREVVGKLETAGSGKLDEAVTAIAVCRKTAGIQRGIEIAISETEEQIADCVGRWRGARHPDTAIAAVPNQV